MAARRKKDSLYMGNPNVPSRGAEFEYTEEMLSEISKCKEDILYFAEEYFTILIPGKGKEKITLFAAQKRVLAKMISDRFFCLISSRQCGKSTIMTIYLLWLAIFFGDERILLVANKEATAIEIFGRIRLAYELLPNWLKSPVDGEYGKTSMKLENDSRISISTTTGTAARGQSVSCVDGESIVTIKDKETDIIFDISMRELNEILKNDNIKLTTVLIEDEPSSN